MGRIKGMEIKSRTYWHTSGEDRAEFWNGTGEHKTGTSTPDREVKRVLQSTGSKVGKQQD